MSRKGHLLRGGSDIDRVVRDSTSASAPSLHGRDFGVSCSDAVEGPGRVVTSFSTVFGAMLVHGASSGVLLSALAIGSVRR